MSEGDTVPLHPRSSQSDIDEIESLINVSVQPATLAVTAVVPAAVALPARPPSPPRASIPVSTAPVPLPSLKSNGPSVSSGGGGGDGASSAGISAAGFGSSSTTLTEPVWDTVKRDVMRIVNNLKLVVFPNPYREDPGKALRDWDLWGPFFFIIFLGLTLSWSASIDKSKVFAVAFAVLAAGAVVLTLNVLLLGGHIIFFQSLSLLGYCLFPLDVGALVCMLKSSVVVKIIVVLITLAWSSWAAYPFMSAAVGPSRKGLALYPVFLLYISVGFLIFAID